MHSLAGVGRFCSCVMGTAEDWTPLFVVAETMLKAPASIKPNIKRAERTMLLKLLTALREENIRLKAALMTAEDAPQPLSFRKLLEQQEIQLACLPPSFLKDYDRLVWSWSDGAENPTSGKLLQYVLSIVTHPALEQLSPPALAPMDSGGVEMQWGHMA